MGKVPILLWIRRLRGNDRVGHAYGSVGHGALNFCKNSAICNRFCELSPRCKIGGQLTYAELVTTCPLISHEGLFELSTNTNFYTFKLRFYVALSGLKRCVWHVYPGRRPGLFYFALSGR